MDNEIEDSRRSGESEVHINDSVNVAKTPFQSVTAGAPRVYTSPFKNLLTHPFSLSFHFSFSNLPHRNFYFPVAGSFIR